MKNQRDRSSFPSLDPMLFNKITPYEALERTQRYFSTRVMILPSAWRSAERLYVFKYNDQLGKRLFQLSTAYVDALQAGKGDVEARAIFGKAYAAKEAETLHERGRRQRTFQYNGSTLFMEQHLKIGTNKPSTAETARIYFHWDSRVRRVIIGWCGPHLPLA